MCLFERTKLHDTAAQDHLRRPHVLLFLVPTTPPYTVPHHIAPDVAESDVWLADMNYRVAVTQQARVWKGVSAKLGDLFGRMKDIEVERRMVRTYACTMFVVVMVVAAAAGCRLHCCDPVVCS